MKQILLIGHHVAEFRELTDTLKGKFKEQKIVTCQPRREEIKKKLSSETDLVIFNFLSPFSQSKANLSSLRNHGFNNMVLMLSPVDDRDELQKMASQKNVLVMEKPISIDDFKCVVQKSLDKKAIQQRIHQRHRFEQTVGFETFGRSGQIAAIIKKISRGGAQLQLLAQTKIHIGEIIQLHVDLPGVKRRHIMQARIVNSESNEAVGANEHFGISWMNQMMKNVSDRQLPQAA